MGNATTVVCTLQSGTWRGVCECGWAMSSSRSGHRGVVALQYVAAHAGRHFVAAHGSSTQLQLRRGRTVRLVGVQEGLLSREERERYKELVGAANFRDGRGPRPAIRMKSRDYRTTLAVFPLWVALAVVSFVLMVKEDQAPEPHPDTFLWIMMVVLFGGIVALIAVMARDIDNWRRRLVGDYLDSIGFHERSPRQLSGGSYADNDDFKTKRQRQHEWYGDHHELDWRDREQAESWGMDADTYVSNWLENDKD